MRVAMDTVVVDREFRRRLAMYGAAQGFLATRREVQLWYESNGDSANIDLYKETDDLWFDEVETKQEE